LAIALLDVDADVDADVPSRASRDESIGSRSRACMARTTTGASSDE
jgi:hypothetical protein